MSRFFVFFGEAFLAEFSSAAAACPMGASIHFPNAKLKVFSLHVFCRCYLKNVGILFYPFRQNCSGFLMKDLKAVR